MIQEEKAAGGHTGAMAAPASSAPAVGTIFNVQRFSVHDGPGIRTTIFFKGCPLRCPWCHNPESLRVGPEFMVRDERCLSCGQCAEVCSLENGPLAAGRLLGRAGCVSCRSCVGVCPTGAREIVGDDVSVDEVMARVLRDRIFFESSGGGVTFSGGEPLMQAEFLDECIDRCRSEGLHVALDTCGYAPRDVLLDIAARVDLLLFDLKMLDRELHRELVGVDLQPILDNLEALAGGETPIWIRVPVVPGVNGSPDEMSKMARVVDDMPAVEKVCLLPFHRTGEGKRAALAMDSGFVERPNDCEIEQLMSPFQSKNLVVQVGG